MVVILYEYNSWIKKYEDVHISLLIDSSWSLSTSWNVFKTTSLSIVNNLVFNCTSVLYWCKGYYLALCPINLVSGNLVSNWRGVQLYTSCIASGQGERPCWLELGRGNSLRRRTWSLPIVAPVCPSTLTIGGPGHPHPPVHVGLCLPQGGGNENCVSESLGCYLADELREPIRTVFFVPKTMHVLSWNISS